MPLRGRHGSSRKSSNRRRDQSSGDGDRSVGVIRVGSARMVWSVDRANRRGRDVWVSTADPPQEAYTAEHFSLQWTFVVGNGNVDWLRNPLCTPEAVFGPKAAIGFASPVEAINAIRPFAKIDACDWTRAMFARVAPGDA